MLIVLLAILGVKTLKVPFGVGSGANFAQLRLPNVCGNGWKNLAGTDEEEDTLLPSARRSLDRSVFVTL